jgi:pyruvate,water dikinase
LPDCVDFLHTSTGITKSCGGKAEHLARLTAAGFAVPRWFYLATDYLEERLRPQATRREALIAGTAATELQALVREVISSDLSLPQAQLDWTERELSGALLYSVRSSASVEDGAAHSFAGQFTTMLSVSREALPEAVCSCLASLYADNVLDYCAQAGIAAGNLHMAVIIQEMIPSDLSGVIFTVNPRGLWNEAVFVVGRGTGDLIVEDKTEVTTYYYNKTDRLSYYETVGNSPLLTAGEAATLIAEMDKLTELYGEALDIEFAFSAGVLYLLQYRAITTLSAESPIILDNSNIVESYPGITLPLSESFVYQAYAGVFRNVVSLILRSEKKLLRYEPILQNMVAAVNGRMYYRINNWFTVISLLPGKNKVIPIWQEMLGIKNRDTAAELSLPLGERALIGYRFVKEFFAVPRSMKALEITFRETQRTFQEAYAQSPTGILTNAALLSLYTEIAEKVLANWGVTLLNDMYAFLYTGALKALLQRVGGDANAMITGMPGLASMEPVRELRRLALLARESGAELTSLRTDDEVRRYLRSGTPLAQALRNYIESYGDRAPEELKLEALTFRANPLLLVQKVLSEAAEADADADVDAGAELAAIADAGTTVDAGAEPRLAVDGEGLKVSFCWRPLVNFLQKGAKTGIANRESSRFNRSRIYGMVREIFLSIARNLVASHDLTAERDIFYLTIAEIEAYVKGESTGSDLRELIASRRADYAMSAKLPAYSRLVFQGKIFSKTHANINSGKTTTAAGELKGVPCAGGTAEGEALVVTDPTQVSEPRGKILITKMTDPGWVFLLTAASGIIAEKGSLLSHTAIIARELKIPAVVGLTNATEIFQTGERLRIDGDTGKITRLS